MRGRRDAWVVLGMMALLSSCWSAPPEPLNIVVVVVDTLRADRLGAYGNGSGLTPFLDELAARGTVFTNAYAASSWTLPSVASLLTSRFPSQHHVTTFDAALSDEELTLPETLAAAGYRAGGVTANFLLRQAGGFAQGFEAWQALAPTAPAAKVRADEVRHAALAWVEQARSAAPTRPLLLYLQYMEPHAPYEPPPAYRERFEVPGTTAAAAAAANAKVVNLHVGDLTASEVPLLASLYDAEVAALDAELRALFGELDRSGLLRHALVVVTADHGEEFLEHGAIGHGTTLFEPAVRVPLIVLAPGRASARVAANVSAVDLAPTILELAGLPPEPRFEGRSLVPYLAPPAPTGWLSRWRSAPRAEPPPAADVLCELERVGARYDFRVHSSALVRDHAKVVIGKNGWAHLFDLDQDPGEQRPESWDDGERVALQEALTQRREALATAARPVHEVRVIDSATREKMRALGYGF